jgi:hypothetical protein
MHHQRGRVETILGGRRMRIPVQPVQAFLQKRGGLLDWKCTSGGMDELAACVAEGVRLQLDAEAPIANRIIVQHGGITTRYDRVHCVSATLAPDGKTRETWTELIRRFSGAPPSA